MTAAGPDFAAAQINKIEHDKVLAPRKRSECTFYVISVTARIAYTTCLRA